MKLEIVILICLFIVTIYYSRLKIEKFTNDFLTDYCIYRRVYDKELLCNSNVGVVPNPQDSSNNPQKFNYF